ncbi:class I SAM-dependent methyltransferase [Leekyejoonella antrihumi]|uniref:Class I SAM-dependent methyltransferase n=1 Tax=Leekyejoonella antrihumi TaxID=1660198 RepID=A0A563E7F7_9MICO|nr:class I SAM-dependent methyltransferase [Leekyejoonella antrihumi]TWP38193.1 class I SAM-dependent methyltransferase [Leekyejoonella antrihumi]
MSTPDEAAAELAHESLSTGDVIGWFEPLYAAAAVGDAVIPWDRGEPHPLLVDWAAASAGTSKDSGSAHDAVETEAIAGASTASSDEYPRSAVETEAIAGASAASSGRALVVGCGPGHDAELIASLGYDTTAFDVSDSAIVGARGRHPHTTARYLVANLFELPTDWHRAFDLVVEVMTVQAMPRTVRAKAIATIRDLVAPGGTLLVIGMHLPDDWMLEQGPPWPLTSEELETFASDGLQGRLISAPREDGPDNYRYTLTRNDEAQ